MISLASKNKDFLKIPESTDSLDTYKAYARENMAFVFNLDDLAKYIPLEWFLENTDHGAQHTYNVFKKSLEIAELLTKETNIFADTSLLYIMSALHDSGRFRLPIHKESDSPAQKQAKDQKRKKAESEHASYGVAQVKLGIKQLKEKNIQLSHEEQEKIEDYIFNHDFFNERLDGDKYHEPVSIEGQITRLSDRISTPIEQEIERYWETGKRLGTPYFNKNISWQERTDFTFTNMETYIKSGKFDEFTFLLSLLSQKADDFSHPVLAEIYQKWAKSKQEGIVHMLNIASDEWYPDEDIQQMKKLIEYYLKYFDIRF